MSSPASWLLYDDKFGDLLTAVQMALSGVQLETANRYYAGMTNYWRGGPPPRLKGASYFDWFQWLLAQETGFPVAKDKAPSPPWRFAQIATDIDSAKLFAESFPEGLSIALEPFWSPQNYGIIILVGGSGTNTSEDDFWLPDLPEQPAPPTDDYN